jgi:hypothetical protein
MATWKCLGCANTVEQGSLTCGQCCCSMRLQRDQESDGSDHNPAVDRLFDKAEDAGLTSENLDELVHELAASIAADVNNSGLEDQIRYLVKDLGVSAVEKQLDQIIEGRKGQSEEP